MIAITIYDRLVAEGRKIAIYHKACDTSALANDVKVKVQRPSATLLM
jgi:hypothetical protein